DGRKCYVQVIKTPIYDAQGAVLGIQGIVWDVTEKMRAEQALAESERRYRQVTEASLDAIVVADGEGRIALFNAAAERYFGYSAAEAVGQPLSLLVPENYRAQHDRGLRRYVATRQARLVGRTIELTGRRKDGSEFPLELSLNALDLGGDLQFVGAMRDLTERNRMRAIMVQTEKLASIGMLSAGVAHEINNPLAYVSNNLAVLERDNRGLLALVDIYHQANAALAKVDPVTAQEAREIAEEMDLEYVQGNLHRLLARTRDGVERVSKIIHSLRGLARTAPPQYQDTSIPDLI